MPAGRCFCFAERRRYTGSVIVVSSYGSLYSTCKPVCVCVHSETAQATQKDLNIHTSLALSVIMIIDFNEQIVHSTLASVLENWTIIFDLRSFNELLSFCVFMVPVFT